MNADDAGSGLLELAALIDRQEQQTADRYAGGDRERLHQMWMSGELCAIWGRETIAALRQHGKHDLADHYERRRQDAPRWKPPDYLADELKRTELW